MPHCTQARKPALWVSSPCRGWHDRCARSPQGGSTMRKIAAGLVAALTVATGGIDIKSLGVLCAASLATSAAVAAGRSHDVTPDIALFFSNTSDPFAMRG